MFFSRTGKAPAKGGVGGPSGPGRTPATPGAKPARKPAAAKQQRANNRHVAAAQDAHRPADGAPPEGDTVETGEYQDVAGRAAADRSPSDDTAAPRAGEEWNGGDAAGSGVPVPRSAAARAAPSTGPLLVRLVDESGNRIEAPRLEFISADGIRIEAIPGERHLDLPPGRWRVVVAREATLGPAAPAEPPAPTPAPAAPASDVGNPAEPEPEPPVQPAAGDTLLDKLRAYYEQHGHPWDELNLLGIRCVDVPYKGQYKDLLVVADDKGVTVLRFTTHYGLGWNADLMKRYGVTYCADYVPGYYTDSHTVWNHRGYEALSQRSPVKLRIDDAYLPWFRKSKDGKKKGQFDEATRIFTTAGSDGMNIHKSGGDWGNAAKTSVGVASAGCQVICSHRDFRWFMGKVTGTRKYKKLGRGKVRYSYWLVESDSFPLYEEIKAVKRGAP